MLYKILLFYSLGRALFLSWAPFSRTVPFGVLLKRVKKKRHGKRKGARNSSKQNHNAISEEEKTFNSLWKTLNIENYRLDNTNPTWIWLFGTFVLWFIHFNSRRLIYKSGLSSKCIFCLWTVIAACMSLKIPGALSKMHLKPRIQWMRT